MFGKHRPSFGAFTTPLYSTPPFVVLSWVIEAATGKDFDTVVRENVFDVADMASTSTGKKPDDGTGFIPADSPWWDGDLGYLNPYVPYFCLSFFFFLEDLVVN